MSAGHGERLNRQTTPVRLEARTWSRRASVRSATGRGRWIRWRRSSRSARPARASTSCPAASTRSRRSSSSARASALTFMSGFAVSAARLAAPDTGPHLLRRDARPGPRHLRGRLDPRDRRRRHRLRQPAERAPHGRGLRPRGLRLRDDRGPARAEALRPHARQAGRGARGGAGADPRRGRRARGRAPTARHGAHRRARRRSASTRRSGARRAFADLGADLVFVEAPRSEAEISACAARGAARPAWRTSSRTATRRSSRRARLEAMGYRIAAYPLTLLSCRRARDAGGARGARARAARPSAGCSFAELRAAWSASTPTTRALGATATAA